MTNDQRIRFMKRAIKTLELNNSSFARRMGVQQPYVPRWLRGDSDIRGQTLLAIECLLRRDGKWPMNDYSDGVVYKAITDG